MTLRAKKCLHINGRSSWNDPEQLALKVSEKYRNFYGKNVFLFLSFFVSLYILQNIFISIKFLRILLWDVYEMKILTSVLY